jgi:hypothetical protein
MGIMVDTDTWAVCAQAKGARMRRTPRSHRREFQPKHRHQGSRKTRPPIVTPARILRTLRILGIECSVTDLPEQLEHLPWLGYLTAKARRERRPAPPSTSTGPGPPAGDAHAADKQPGGAQGSGAN